MIKYILILFISQLAYSGDFNTIQGLAHSNGFNPSNRVVKAIYHAARLYHIPVKELTAIAILETGIGFNAKVRHNSNGTLDIGLFQINTVNQSSCKEFNLTSIEGNALCAAKLLHRIAHRHSDYLGRYHSKTPSHKIKYIRAIKHILAIE